MSERREPRFSDSEDARSADPAGGGWRADIRRHRPAAPRRSASLVPIILIGVVAVAGGAFLVLRNADDGKTVEASVVAPIDRSAPPTSAADPPPADPVIAPVAAPSPQPAAAPAMVPTVSTAAIARPAKPAAKPAVRPAPVRAVPAKALGQSAEPPPSIDGGDGPPLDASQLPPLDHQLTPPAGQ